MADLFFVVDSKYRDFVIFNADAYNITNEEIMDADLVELRIKNEPPDLIKMKSQAWSAGCSWFFVLKDEGIYLVNVHDETIWLCRKHSSKFIAMYLTTKKTKEG